MDDLKEVSIEVTNKCSQRCLHCSSNADYSYRDELSLSEIKDLLFQAKSLGADIFTISGGDPLLRYDISEIIDLARKQEFKIRLQTAGAYDFGKGLVSIPEHFLDFYLKDLGARDKIIYNIMGVNETHDKITSNKGSFNKVIESIRKTKGKNIFTEVHTVPNALNYKEIPEIALRLNGENVNRWHLLRLVHQGRCKSNPKLIMNKAQSRKLQKTLIKLSQNNFRLKLKLGHNIDKRFWSDKSFPVHSCNIGREKILIRANGDLTYCAALKYSKFGNVRDNSLKYFWNEHPAIVSFRKFIKHDYKMLKGKCSHCDIKNSCKGGCIAQRLYSYNDLIKGPDPTCHKK